MSADDASKYLISTLQGFQMAADQAEDIVDMYNQVANNFAIDTAGIGQALERSAASFYASNTELSKAIALVTSANEVLQNPEVVGTTFKTLSARIRGAKTELEELGEEEDEFTQTTSKLRSLVKSLTGFDIMKDKDTFKDIYEILLGIGKEWDTLTDVERASLGEALAGKRNSNALFAVLGNLDTLQEAYEAAENSAGSAAREQENYAQSIQYSIDRVKASIEELSYDFLDSGMVKGAVEFANDLLQLLDKIIEKTDSLPGVIAGIGAAIASVKLGKNFDLSTIDSFGKSIKNAAGYINIFNDAMKFDGPITEEFINNMDIADDKLKNYLVKSLDKGKASLAGYGASLVATTAETIALEVATMALKTVIAAGISLAVSFLVSQITKAIEATKNARKEAIQTANALKEESEELDKQIDKFKELRKQLDDTSKTEDEVREIKENLVGVQKELNDKYKDEAERLDLVNGKYQDQLDILEGIDRKKAKRYTNENRAEYENAQKELQKSLTSSISGVEATDSDFEILLKKYSDILSYDVFGNEFVVTLDVEKGEAEEKLQAFADDLGELEDRTGRDYTGTLNDVSALIKKIQNDTDLQESIDLVDQYTSNLIAGDKYLSDTYEAATTAVNEWNEALKSGGGIDTAKEKLEDIQQTISEMTFEDENVAKAFDKVWGGINQTYQKAYDAEQKMIASMEDGSDILALALNKVKAFNLKEDDFIGGLGGIDADASAAIMTVMTQLGYTKDELEDVVSLLVKIGLVEGNIAEESETAFGGTELKSYLKTLEEVSEASMKDTELTKEQLAALRKPFEQLGKQFPQLKDDFTVLNEEFLQGTDLWADALTNVKNAVLGLRLDELGEDFEKAAGEFSLPLKIDNEEKVRLLNELKELGKGGHVDLTVRPVIPTDWLNDLGWDAGEGAATIFTSTYTNKAGNIAMNFTPIITDENGNYVAALTPDELQEYAEGVINGVHVDYLKLKIGATFTGDDALQQAEEAAEKIHQFHEKYFLNKTYEIPLEINEEGFEEFKTDLDNYIEADKSITIQVNADISDNISTISDKLSDINTAAALVAKNFKVSFSDLEGLSAVFPGILEGMTILKDGSVQLNKEVAQSVISAVQAEADADAQSVMDRLNLQATLLESKAKTYKEMAEAASVLAGNEVDSEMTATEARTQLNAGLAEIEQINSKLTTNEVNKNQKAVADSAYENGEQTQKNWEAAAQGSEEAMYNFATAANEYQTAVAEHRAIKRMSVSNTTYSGSTGTYNETDLLAETKNALESDAELQQQMYEELRERYLEAAAVAEKAAATARDGISMIQATRKFTKYNLDQVSQGKAGSTKSESMESKKDEYKQVIDYFERMVKVIDNSISLLEAHLEDVTGSFAKNSLLSAEEDLIQSKLNGYSAAVDMYSKKAEEALAKIPKDIADKLINGAVDIDTFIDQSDDEVVKAISDYQSWADKVNDARLQLVQLKETLRQLELQKFNNILKDFTDQIDLRQSSGIDLISKQIELLQEAGELIGEGYYQQQKELTERNLRALEEARESLVAQLNEALSRGVDVGSDEWLEMQQSLIDVESKIYDCKKALEEFDNALLALHTEVFNRIQDQFSLYQSELSNMEALFDDESIKVADENGEWTKEGLARLGLLAQQYELAQEQVRMYGEEIEKLNQDYLDGKYSTTEYMEKLAQLKEEQWSAVNASEEAKKAMIALNKARVEIVIEGIEKEIEAYEELIQKQKDLLSAEKDLHDYQKSIAESEKDIVALQKQLAAIAGDDSAAARAKRLKLEEQLAEKQSELEEKQYDHSIDQQQDALDKQLEQYKETRQLEIEELQNSLLEIEKLLTDAFEAVRENSETIGNEIIEKAREHGIEMSECLTDAWFQGENAIARYGETLTSETSNFISGIQEVENNIWELQDQANATADDLANMLATRADNLVDELVRSYDSEANLDAMTNALHDSLSSTIDGSYAGTSAKNALAGITDAADELADSAERARRALLDLLEVETKTPKWEIYDRHGNLITTTDDPDEARKFADDPTVIVKRVGGYARGSKRISQNEVAWTQEKGPEMIISPSSGSILTPLKAGDAVIPADMTSNLWEWGRFNPEEFAEKLLSSAKIPSAGSVTANTMQIGSLVTVNGNVNDSIEMMKIASQQATAKIKQSWNDFSNTIRG